MPPLNHHHIITTIPPTFYNMKPSAKQEQMVIALGSEIGLPFQVWHEEKQQWIKCESDTPIRDRDMPRPTHRTALVNAPMGGCRSVRIPIPPESPVVRSVEHLLDMLRSYRNEGLQLAVEDAAGGEPVRIVEIRFVGKQVPAYIPAMYEHDTTNATAEELAAYRRRISASPGVSDDFAWYASSCWNDFEGGSTELWLPEQQQWVRAEALEYPRCLPHNGKYLTMEQEHGYGGLVAQKDGSVLFDWFPVIYEVVLEHPCTINIAAGYNGRRRHFTMRGQNRPANEVSQAPTH